MSVRSKYLTQAVVMRARALLDMLYTPDELAQELRIPKRTIYELLIPHGLKTSQDSKHRVWINGKDVSAWFRHSK